MKKIVLHEVGMRDGLQPEKLCVPTETKIQWIDSLISAGIDLIQIGSFVKADKVPPMADSDELFRHYAQPGKKPSGVQLSGLVLNEKGLERGMEVGVDMFCMGVSASETHSKKNTGMSVDDAVSRIINMAKSARSAGKKVQLSVQSAFGCGFEGKIDENRVIGIVDKFLENDFTLISLADTAGHAYPEQVTRMYSAILAKSPDADLACHFHNTYGLGVANVYAAVLAGVSYVETAFGGLGGCPFTKVAAGNVCTEDYVAYLQRKGEFTHINISELIEVSKIVAIFFERDLPGSVYKIGPVKY